MSGEAGHPTLTASCETTHPTYFSRRFLGPTYTMDNQADIRTSKLSGNGLFAKKYIDAGQSIITIKRPLVALLDSQQLEDTCSNCFRRNSAGDNDEVIKVSACTGCQIVRYCGKVMFLLRPFSDWELLTKCTKVMSREIMGKFFEYSSIALTVNLMSFEEAPS